MYDKPPPAFRRATLAEKHDLFTRLAPELPIFPAGIAPPPPGSSVHSAQATLLTEIIDEIGASGDGAAAAPTGMPPPLPHAASEEAPLVSPPRVVRRGGRGGRAAASGVESSRESAAAAQSALLSTLPLAALDAASVLGPSHTSPLSPPAPPSPLDAAPQTLRARPGRPAVLVSSTSWTEDEDFGLLLDALVALDGAVSAPARARDYPDFLVLVTGKGPQRAAYEARIARLRLRRVAIRTLWLSPADYPTLLGCADVGICLHTSTSGLDLPMKVVDMFGAGLPVAAVAFDCLSELVRHDVNGLVFHDAAQLTEQLLALFDGFPDDPSAQLLERLRRGVRRFQAERWHDNWLKHAWPVLAE